MMVGQTRVFWTMCKDGLLPPFISRVHPRFKTPWVITIITGIVVAIVGGLIPVGDAGDLCNIGTLLAFVIVSIGVLVLRVREPNLERRFKTPLVWVVAPLGALSSFGLMLFLPLGTWIRLVGWFAIGVVIYFLYGVRHSKLASPPTNPTAPQKEALHEVIRLEDHPGCLSCATSRGGGFFLPRTKKLPTRPRYRSTS